MCVFSKIGTYDLKKNTFVENIKNYTLFENAL